jgi:hypothetical protein
MQSDDNSAWRLSLKFSKFTLPIFSAFMFMRLKIFIVFQMRNSSNDDLVVDVSLGARKNNFVISTLARLAQAAKRKSIVRQ